MEKDPTPLQEGACNGIWGVDGSFQGKKASGKKGERSLSEVKGGGQYFDNVGEAKMGARDRGEKERREKSISRMLVKKKKERRWAKGRGRLGRGTGQGTVAA